MQKNNSNTLVKLIFNEDLAYTFSGHNIFCGRTYLKEYSTDDERCAIVLRDSLLSSSTVNICQGSSSIDLMLRGRVHVFLPFCTVFKICIKRLFLKLC